MTTKVNVLKAQIAQLQAEIDKVEKPSRILDELQDDLGCVNDDIDAYKNNIKYAMEEIADATKGIKRCEKLRAKLLAKIAKVKGKK
jgi:peptidoglycan hydrolase CwlO-like protein